MHSENSAPPLPHIYEDLSGRPPDGISSIAIPSSLERPDSPTPLEEQYVVKKVRSGSHIDSALESSDMEADQVNRPGVVYSAVDPSRYIDSSSMGHLPFALILRSMSYGSGDTPLYVI
ncbi:hypothetical protein V6N13_037337 [Hibiscus sabdariffa]|uniref:Uncharacterized protein n=1 Tax=Hibiscus sabdariffa TaxID=183260 RepID=A0ABR2E974_9ROSI